MLQHSTHLKPQKPTGAFVMASWSSFFIGAVAYLVGVWNSTLPLTEKGYYFTLLMYGLFSAISLQKVVRDRLEGIVVTDIYYMLSWISMLLSILLLGVGLWNSSMLLSEKGFYIMAFVLSLFSSITIQKNIRDLALFPKDEFKTIDIEEEE